MRVAFVDQTGDVIGGAQESLWLLLDHLPPDIEPVVILFHEGSFAERLRKRGLRVEIVTVSAAIAQSTRSRVNVTSLIEIPKVGVRLYRLLRRLRVDAVHTNTVKAHFLALPVAFALALPTVAHLRDILTGRSRAALRLILRVLRVPTIAISSTVRDCYALTRSRVVRNPLDLRLFLNLETRENARRNLKIERSGTPLFAIVGRVNRWKGHDLFLTAASQVVAVHPHAHFAIVGESRFGDETYVSELQDMTERLGLTDRVIFLGWQSDVAALYPAIDVLVNCSHREPFGRTVIEAGAAGIPTICYDDAGVVEFMREAGIGGIVKAGDVDELSQAMIAYARDEDLRLEAGRKAKALAQTFDANVHAQTVADILRGVARRG